MIKKSAAEVNKWINMLYRGGCGDEVLEESFEADEDCVAALKDITIYINELVAWHCELIYYYSRMSEDCFEEQSGWQGAGHLNALAGPFDIVLDEKGVISGVNGNFQADIKHAESLRWGKGGNETFDALVDQIKKRCESFGSRLNIANNEEGLARLKEEWVAKWLSVPVVYGK